MPKPPSVAPSPLLGVSGSRRVNCFTATCPRQTTADAGMHSTRLGFPASASSCRTGPGALRTHAPGCLLSPDARPAALEPGRLCGNRSGGRGQVSRRSRFAVSSVSSSTRWTGLRCTTGQCCSRYGASNGMPVVQRLEPPPGQVDLAPLLLEKQPRGERLAPAHEVSRGDRLCQLVGDELIGESPLGAGEQPQLRGEVVSLDRVALGSRRERAVLLVFLTDTRSALPPVSRQ
jgi:hypothetical protein